MWFDSQCHYDFFIYEMAYICHTIHDISVNNDENIIAKYDSKLVNQLELKKYKLK